MFHPFGILVERENFTPFAEQMDEIAPIPTAGIQHLHTRRNIPAQDLIEHVNVDLPELLLNVQETSGCI